MSVSKFKSLTYQNLSNFLSLNSTHDTIKMKDN